MAWGARTPRESGVRGPGGRAVLEGGFRGPRWSLWTGDMGESGSAGTGGAGSIDGGSEVREGKFMVVSVVGWRFRGAEMRNVKGWGKCEATSHWLSWLHGFLILKPLE